MLFSRDSRGRPQLISDLRVVAQLRSRTLGNSASWLYNTLREQHIDTWTPRAIQYLGMCEQFLALCTGRGQFPPLPQMPPLPSPIWVLTVYSWMQLECKARITSTFRSILKMDSTKKVSNNWSLFSYSCFYSTAACLFKISLRAEQYTGLYRKPVFIFVMI